MTTDHKAAPQAITRRLVADERLVWWDRPEPVRYARRELNYGTFFGVVFFLFAVFWMTQAARAPGPSYLFGIPFVLAGLWMVTTPLRAYWNAGSMMFALTDKRALIVTGAKVTARPLDHIPFVETESFPDGRGDVLFIDEPAGLAPLSWSMRQMTRKSGFIAVADAERVGQEMLQLLQRRRGSDGSIANAGQR